MAYDADLGVPFGTEVLWGRDAWVDSVAAFAAAPPTGSVKTFFNRKFHVGSGTYHHWTTTGSSDPQMAQTTPPQTKSEYTDHVVTGVRLIS